MIIPNSNSAKHPNVTNPQIFPGHGIFTPHGIIYVPSPPISPNNMWVALMQFHYTAMGAPIPAYQSTDQAFIDEWDNAIDMYGEIFLGLTLVATTGSGLPNFNDLPVAPPSGYGPDCEDENMDCAAEATILSYFAEASIGGANAKATQTSGLEVSRADNVDLGVLGVKFLSDTTATPNDFSTQILGGLQLNTSVSQHAEEEGSSSVVEQALYNVLQVIFNGTAVASSYCQTVGMAPLNYVQIYSNDFLYAGKNGAVSVHEGSCLGTHSMSAQDELNAASALLLSISEPQPAP
jgi:hypothetical protein